MKLSIFKNKSFYFLIAVFAFLLLYYLTSLSNIINFSLIPLNKAGRVFYNIRQNVILSINNFKKLNEIGKTIIQQEKEILNLSAENAKLNQLKAENEDLKKLIEFSKNDSYEIIASNIVLYNNENDSTYLIIDSGLENGIQNGDPVISPDGVLVGKIEKSLFKLSYVLPLSDNKSSIAASSAKYPNVSMVLKGKLGLFMEMDLIPQELDLKQSDIIISSRLEEGVPDDLLIGKIEEIDYKEGELFKKAKILPLFNINFLKTVGIIKMKSTNSRASSGAYKDARIRSHFVSAVSCGVFFLPASLDPPKAGTRFVRQ